MRESAFVFAPEFVVGLASVLTMEETEVRTVDRALASSGLRQKAKGRFYPHVTRTEAVRLLLGVAVARKLTEAAEVVSMYERFTLGSALTFVPDADPKAALGFSLQEARQMTLAEAMGRTCGKLAKLEEPVGVWIEVEVGGPVTIWGGSGDIELQFTSGADYEPVTKGMSTVHSFRPHALGWVGQNTED